MSEVQERGYVARHCGTTLRKESANRVGERVGRHTLCSSECLRGDFAGGELEHGGDALCYLDGV